MQIEYLHFEDLLDKYALHSVHYLMHSWASRLCSARLHYKLSATVIHFQRLVGTWPECHLSSSLAASQLIMAEREGKLKSIALACTMWALLDCLLPHLLSVCLAVSYSLPCLSLPPSV